MKIERPGANTSPIWSLQWNPSRWVNNNLLYEPCKEKICFVVCKQYTHNAFVFCRLVNIMEVLTVNKLIYRFR